MNELKWLNWLDGQLSLLLGLHNSGGESTLAADLENVRHAVRQREQTLQREYENYLAMVTEDPRD